MTDGSQTADRLNAPEFLRGNIILPLILLVFCAVIVLAGFRVYQAQKKEVESAAAAQLSAIDLKVQQVRAWRSERLGAATFLASNPMLAAPVSPEETAELQEWLQRFRDQYGYLDVAVVGPTGRVLVGDLDRPADRRLRDLVAEALRSGHPVASDLDRYSGQSAKMDIVAPGV